MAYSDNRKASPFSGNEPGWYRQAIVYELHVRAFHDGNGDGIGDFKGLVEKLDYLQDLGVTAIWLLPFYPSPLRDDGYDTADYCDIHPDYGSLADFKLFLREAHRRRLRVITELVLNHTSDQHPWFQRARRAPPNSPERDFYHWSRTPKKFRGTRIIFRDFEPSNWAWDRVARTYYWHRFYAHQPDLNYENPAVRNAMLDVVDFWLDLGVDGLRLDAVPYLYEREGTSCENLPETHAFLRELRAHVDERYRNRLLLAEANQWPEDAVAYFGRGDECHMAFHFPLMPRLFMAIKMEDRYPIADIMEKTPPIPAGCQWALFARNHDELTLEMVTDEDRDYMYRVYATDPQARLNLGIRRRLAPLLDNERRQIELMYALLFSLPGTPFLYYGDEIGMGDNIYLGDRAGVRTPMQWSPDRNAGFSRANPQRLYLPVIIDPAFHYETVNVEAQRNNSQSLFRWLERLIAVRRRHRVLGEGSFELLRPENPKILAFVRQLDDERLLVLVNLSRFAQCTRIDLHAFQGLVPVEAFGRTPFIPIGEEPYFFTLAPHSFFWFSLEKTDRSARTRGSESFDEVPVVTAVGHWRHLFETGAQGTIEDLFRPYLERCWWFDQSGRPLLGVRLIDMIPLARARAAPCLLLVRVEFAEGPPSIYLLPVGYAGGRRAAPIAEQHGEAVLGRIEIRDDLGRMREKGLLYDPLAGPLPDARLLTLVSRRRRLKTRRGTLVTSPRQALGRLLERMRAKPVPTIVRGEHGNTTLIYEKRVVLKIYRRLDEGINPDLEVRRFLAEKTSFRSIPPLVGAASYEGYDGSTFTLALVQGYVPHERCAWDHTLDDLLRSLEMTAARDERPPAPSPPSARRRRLCALPDAIDKPSSPFGRRLVGPYLASAALLGQRTAELHVSLASRPDQPAFAVVPFDAHYQRSRYEALRSIARRCFELLASRPDSLPEPFRAPAARLPATLQWLEAHFRRLTQTPLDARRIRCHGHYHLRQVLQTGDDFVIIDFEGDPARPITERRLARSPLTDVASMLCSLHHAGAFALKQQENPRPAVRKRLEQWTRIWLREVTTTFLAGYLEHVRPAGLLPGEKKDLYLLLELCLMERIFHELLWTLTSRQELTWVPLGALLEFLGEDAGDS